MQTSLVGYFVCTCAYDAQVNKGVDQDNTLTMTQDSLLIGTGGLLTWPGNIADARLDASRNILDDESSSDGRSSFNLYPRRCTPFFFRSFFTARVSSVALMGDTMPFASSSS